jgi:hypothetical protein
MHALGWTNNSLSNMQRMILAISILYGDGCYLFQRVSQRNLYYVFLGGFDADNDMMMFNSLKCREERLPFPLRWGAYFHHHSLVYHYSRYDM